MTDPERPPVEPLREAARLRAHLEAIRDMTHGAIRAYAEAALDASPAAPRPCHAGCSLCETLDEMAADDPAAPPTYDPPIRWTAPYGGSDPKAKGLASPATPHRVPMSAVWDATANRYRCRTCGETVTRCAAPDYWKHDEVASPAAPRPELDAPMTDWFAVYNGDEEMPK